MNFRLVQFLLATLLALVAMVGHAQNIDLQYENRIKSSHAIQALSGNLFGEYVNEYSGATAFTHVDVSLPGNDALPVQVGRTFSVEDRYGVGSLGGFGDWDVDVPYLFGTFGQEMGWSVDSYSSPNRYKRCSMPTTPYIDNQRFNVYEVWGGYLLHIPGGENGVLIAANYSDSYPEPADGRVYPWITADQSRLRCLDQTRNGYPGEAFALVTQAGLTYYFDWGVEVGMRGIGKGEFARTGRVIGRKRVYLLASRIEDRFGNWVNYNYSGSKLISITASDGRQIALTYTGNGISSVSSPAGIWRYQYDGGGNLAKVIRPDASSWSFAFTGSLRDAPPEPLTQIIDERNPPICAEDMPLERGYEYRVTHPSGVAGKFNFKEHRFYRGRVPWLCSRLPLPDKYEWLLLPYYSDSYSLIARTINGPGVKTQVLSYDYGLSFPMELCSSGPGGCNLFCPPTVYCEKADGRWVTVTQPDGTQTKRLMGVNYGVDEARVLEEQVLDKHGNIIRRTLNDYVKDSEVTAMPFTGVIGQRLTFDPLVGKVRPLRTRTIIQDGMRFNSTVELFDGLARPLRTTNSSAPEL